VKPYELRNCSLRSQYHGDFCIHNRTCRTSNDKEIANKPLSTTRTIFYNNKCSGKYETGKQGTKKCSLWFVFIGA
jgi:hypothetical protein